MNTGESREADNGTKRIRNLWGYVNLKVRKGGGDSNDNVVSKKKMEG